MASAGGLPPDGGSEFLRSKLDEQGGMVSEVQLLDCLQELMEAEFGTFKWHLRHKGFPGYRAIKAYRLERVSREQTVNLMVQTYQLHGAVEVTRKVLEKIDRRDLLDRLDGAVAAEDIGEDEEDGGPCAEKPSQHSGAMADISRFQQMLQSNLKDRLTYAQEGSTVDQQPLADIFTELFVVEGDAVSLNRQHEVTTLEMPRKVVQTERQVKPSEMFVHPSGENHSIRTVLTNGIAGIGKTFLVKKFVLDWTTKSSSQDVHLIFPFTFRDLNLLKGESLSLAELIHNCIPETVDIPREALIQIFKTLQSSGNFNYHKSKYKLLFVLDGFDESNLEMDLSAHDIHDFDVTKSSKVEVLLRKLINGRLLRSARIWITTRPVAAKKIPHRLVHCMTEIRGFTDEQKEEYFRKKFRDQEQARTVISHIKTSRSLHIMCHIPVFCWITATMLEEVLKNRQGGELPKTLTEMYTEFLVYQIERTKERHGEEESIQYIGELAEIAFHQLEKHKIIIYERELKGSRCTKEAAMRTGVFTEIFTKEPIRGSRKKENAFSFVHLTVQEFLAAVFVTMSLVNRNKNVMALPHLTIKNLPLLLSKTSSLKIHKMAIMNALQSRTGHLDLFLRFLLGLSLPSNREKLQDLLTSTEGSTEDNQETIKYIKKKISGNLSPDGVINLFSCLHELNHGSLVEDIQQQLSSGQLRPDQLSPSQWSALGFVLLSSGADLDVFDLRKYSASEEALLRLLPVVKASTKALLSSCQLSDRSCAALASVLSSSMLRELDLSNNDLQDSGVKLLSAGLESPHCRLVVLSLSGCQVSKGGCAALASALASNPTHLRELDLTYNHPGDSAMTLLSAGLDDPRWGLVILRVEHCGKQRLKPGPRKYAFDLTLDPDSVHSRLQLSHNNRRATLQRAEPPEPQPSEWTLLRCADALSGRCYWELDWEGEFVISISQVRGGTPWSQRTWDFPCTPDGFHDRTEEAGGSSASGRAAVFVDCPSGSLSFYSVRSETLRLLQSYSSSFSEPLHVTLGLRSSSSSASSVTLRLL